MARRISPLTTGTSEVTTIAVCVVMVVVSGERGEMVVDVVEAGGLLRAWLYVMSREGSGAGGTGSVRLQSGVRSGCGGTSLAVPASRHHHLIWGSRRLGRALPHASPQSSSGANSSPDFALASQRAILACNLGL